MHSRLYKAFALIVFLPLLIVVFLVFQVYSRTSERNVLQFTQRSVRSGASSVDSVLSNYEKLSMQVYYRPEFIAMLQRIADDGSVAEGGEALASAVLQSLVNYDRHISSAYLLTPVGTFVEGARYQGVDDFLEPYVAAAVERGGRLVYTNAVQMRNIYGQEHEVIYVLRQLRSIVGPVGTLALVVRTEAFGATTPEMELEDVGLGIMDEHGAWVLARGSLEGRLEIPETIAQLIMGEKSGAFLEVVEGEQTLIAFDRLRVPPWTLVYTVPGRLLFADSAVATKITVAITALSALFLAVLSYFLSRQLSRPVRELGNAVERIGAGHFDVQLPETGTAELDLLVHRTREMSQRIAMLVQRVRAEESAKRQAEIRALQMQVGPHFLYNALNTIRWMAAANRQGNIQKTVGSLISLMRSVSKDSSSFVTLSEELRLLSCYVEIQRVRFDDFELNLSVPPELAPCKVIRLITQGLVENSVIHGFHENQGTHMVEVRASLIHDDRLELLVEDNGRGFESSALGDLSHVGEEHTGLRSIEERIRLHYGEGYGLRVDSQVGVGTRVTLTLPVII